MTMAIDLDTGELVRELPPRGPRLLRAIKAWWRRYRDHRRAAAAWMALSRLDDRLLYDLGVEPLDLIEALKREQVDIVEKRAR